MDIAPFLDKPTAIVGTTGAGKTFAAKGAVERLLDLGRRVIIIDPTGAWYGLRARADGSAEGGYPILIFGGDHADIQISPDAGEQVAEAIAGRDVQAIIDTSEMTGGEKTRFLTAFLQKLYALNKAALHLVVDEADEICPQNPMPEERRLSGAFDKIVRRGRIKGFRPLMITQRPAVLHKNVLSQIGTLIALKLTSPQDRKAIEDWVKGNADAGQAREVMSSLPTLQRGQGWVWSPADSVLERVYFPPIRTFDSSRTPDSGESVVAPALTAVDVDALRAAMKVEPAGEMRRPAAAGASKAEIEAAEKRGYDAGHADGRAAGVAFGLKVAREAVASGLDALVEHHLINAGTPSEAGHRASSPSFAGSNPAPASTSSVTRPKRDSTIAPKTEASEDNLPASLQRALDSVVWWHHIGFDEVARNRAAITAGLSPTASTFGVYVGKLVERGLIEAASPGHLRATDAGRAAARVDTGLTVLSMARAQLEPQPARVFDFVVAAYPTAISRGELADKMGLSRTASTLGVYLGKVSRLGFVDALPGSMVRAADFMFEGRK